MPLRGQTFRERCAGRKLTTHAQKQTKLFPRDWHDDDEDVIAIDGAEYVAVEVDGTVERAVTCGEPATAACARCDLPLCERHAPAADMRCAECESEYNRRAQTAPGGYGGCVVVYGPVFAFVYLAVFGWRYGLTLIGASALAVFVLSRLSYRRYVSPRPAFLAEHSPRVRPSESDDPG